MANALTPEQRAEAEVLYAEMQRLQTELWNIASQLESVIGCAVDTSADLNDGVNLDSFIEWDREI